MQCHRDIFLDSRLRGNDERKAVGLRGGKNMSAFVQPLLSLI